MGVIYEKSIWAFLFVTVIAGGGAAFMIGRAAAKGWNPFWQAVVQVLALAAAVRFLHWGLFAGATFESWRQAQGSLFSLHYYLTDAVILLLFAALRLPKAADSANAPAVRMAHCSNKPAKLEIARQRHRPAAISRDSLFHFADVLNTYR